MQIIEVTDPIEARRARIAQFQVRPFAMELAGQRVFGVVKAVLKIATGADQRWIVQLEAKPQPNTLLQQRYNPHTQQFVGLD
jgi:hypothetical protein